MSRDAARDVLGFGALGTRRIPWIWRTLERWSELLVLQNCCGLSLVGFRDFCLGFRGGGYRV